MDLAMRLKDAEEKGVSETVTELIKTAKKFGTDPDTIFNFAKGAAHGKLSDAEINQLIDQQD